MKKEKEKEKKRWKKTNQENFNNKVVLVILTSDKWTLRGKKLFEHCQHLKQEFKYSPWR